MLPPTTIHHPRYKQLQAHLRQLRLTSGLTQVDLAGRVKVDQSYVSEVERGERYVDILSSSTGAVGAISTQQKHWYSILPTKGYCAQAGQESEARQGDGSSMPCAFS
jgi:hypothetical protein|nr:helix-turn-helix transcriptional regulator [Paraburkholderia sp. UYCP14C]